MLACFIFSETSPSAPGTAASSQPVTSAASYLAAGIAGPLDDFDAVDVAAQLAGATGGSLDVYVQSSVDGVNWYDSIHFPTLANGAAAISYRTAVTHLGQPTSAAPVAIGKNLSPALAAGTTVQGGWGDRLRLLMVAGTGTTAGSAIKVFVTAQRPMASRY